DLRATAVRIAVLINPANAPSAETTLLDIPEAARSLGLQIQILNASTSREIEAAFTTLARDQTEALFVAPTGSSPAGASNSRRSRRIIGSPCPISCASSSKWAG